MKTNQQQLRPAKTICSILALCVCAFVSIGQTSAQESQVTPGGFDEMVRSFNQDNAMILEGPALNGPMEVQSKSITPVQANQGNQGGGIMPNSGTLSNQNGNMRSVVSNRQQYPADNPFLDAVPEIQTNTNQAANPTPNVGWQTNLNEMQYSVPAPTITPELTAPRSFPQTSPQPNFSPSLAPLTIPQPPSVLPQRDQPQYSQPQYSQPQYPQPQLTQPRQTAPQLVQPQARQSQFAPSDLRSFGTDDYVCPYEAARLARGHRVGTGYLPTTPGQGLGRPGTPYVPYGGLGVDREYQARRSEVYRPRYSEYDRLELEMMMRARYRAQYRPAPIRYVPYGGHR